MQANSSVSSAPAFTVLCLCGIFCLQMPGWARGILTQISVLQVLLQLVYISHHSSSYQSIHRDPRLPRFYCRYSFHGITSSCLVSRSQRQVLLLKHWHTSVWAFFALHVIPRCLRTNFQFQSSKKTSALKACFSGTMFSLSNIRTGFLLLLYLLKQTNPSINQQYPN